jgi:hypothetical protein
MDSDSTTIFSSYYVTPSSMSSSFTIMFSDLFFLLLDKGSVKHHGIRWRRLPIKGINSRHFLMPSSLGVEIPLGSRQLLWIIYDIEDVWMWLYGVNKSHLVLNFFFLKEFRYDTCNLWLYDLEGQTKNFVFFVNGFFFVRK